MKFNAEYQKKAGKDRPHNSAWMQILYIIREINSLTYVMRAGQITFKSICYVATREGFPTGFVFTKGENGPYCADVEETEKMMFNSDIIREQPCNDQMNVILVSDTVCFDENSISKDEMECIRKIIDLFSRLHDAAEIELMETVMFVFDELKKMNDNLKDTEILDSVCRWKPHWKNSQDDITDMIIFLTEFGWIRCELTPELIHDEFYEFA